MNITRGAQVCGIEVVRLRDALRQTNPISVTPRRLADRLGIDEAEALALCARMVTDGYLQSLALLDEFPEFALTANGGALRNASAGRRIRRATAERHLAALLGRVEQVNANDELLYLVERVLLFGSMLGESETVGDVDVAVGLVAKTDDAELFHRWATERIEAALAAGRRFSNIAEQVGWPNQEVMHFLKAGSAVLSLTTTSDRILESTDSQLLYEHPSSRRSAPRRRIEAGESSTGSSTGRSGSTRNRPASADLLEPDKPSSAWEFGITTHRPSWPGSNS